MDSLKSMHKLIGPHLYWPSCQIVSRRQLNQEPARRWTSEMGVSLSINRKTWERVYVLSALYSRGMLVPGKRGLGFGVGRDPMIPVMVNKGCDLVVSDYGESEFKGWGIGLDLNPRGIADADAMKSRVRFREVDMNEIPVDLTGFAFIYSCGSLEHIGGLHHGLDFVENAMRCLRPGGIAVHTTELNISGNGKTLERPNLSFYLPEHINALTERLRAAGHHVASMNYRMGTRSDDLHIATRPYDPPCIKVRHSGFVVTSMGLIIRAGPATYRPPVVRPQLTAASDLARDATRAIGRRVQASVGVATKR